MKKILSVTFFAFMAMLFINATDAVAQEVNKLPVEARNFISQHFPQAQVSRVKMDDKMSKGQKYEVTFSNGMEVEFDSNGTWKEIDMRNERIPVAILPGAVNTYVNDTYANNYVTKVEHDNDGYKVKLNNGRSLKFDHSGTFKKVDD